MKKLLAFVLTIILIGGLTGCSNESVSLKDEIAPKELTDDQKEIFDLLSVGNEILLYDFKTQEEYRSVEFWVEIYEYGVLISRPAGLHQLSDDLKTLDGRLAVLIAQKPGFQWTFSMDGASQINSEPYIPADDIDTLARGYVPIGGPIAIQDGNEIVLYTSIFSYPDGSAVALYSDLQRYVGHPELIKDYPYVHFIKCKFSK